MIYSALYYPASLAKGDLIVRDNRFYGGKYAETLPVWMAYIRRHYPDEPLTLFADAASPIPWREAAKLLGEPYTYEATDGEYSEGGGVSPSKVHIKVLTQFAGQYFRPMQRNLVEALCDAYWSGEDCTWLDADAFLNTDIRPLVAGYDWASSSIEHHQLTTGSICFHVSHERLCDLDRLTGRPGALPDYLRAMLNDGPTETRMHSLQEGGLYKLFCYGRTRDLGRHINMTHLSCYAHFMAFLLANPLPGDAYARLVEGLTTLVETATKDGRLAGVEMTFHDAYHTAP